MSGVSVTPAWIAVDWGSSNLRAWAVNGDDAVIAQASSARGMLGLAADEFEDVLRVLINDWLPDDATSPMPVLICGMAGARQGWQEAAYLPLPTEKAPSRDVLGALSEQLTHVATRDSRLAVAIVPGLCQQQPSYDVMRGEETQLAGLVAAQPDYSGAVCLPGTHAKWAHLVGGAITGFSTFMSGELFKLLSQDSVLKHSVAAGDLSDAAQRKLSAKEAEWASLFGEVASTLATDRDVKLLAVGPAPARAAVDPHPSAQAVFGKLLSGAPAVVPGGAKAAAGRQYASVDAFVEAVTARPCALEVCPRALAPAYVTRLDTATGVLDGQPLAVSTFHRKNELPSAPRADQPPTARFDDAWGVPAAERAGVAGFAKVGHAWFMVLRGARLPTDSAWPLGGGMYPTQLAPAAHAHRSKWASFHALVAPAPPRGDGVPLVGAALVGFDSFTFFVDGREVTVSN